ncbi:MAG: LysR family transcriptional regulator [Dongiaceae bacterium]
MSRPDLNLLVTLDLLLAEGSVARAARRLRLSPSAMSRALARLRVATGDPLLVRAGRGLVPTPRALALRQRIGPLVQEAEAVLRPAERLDLAGLVRTFTIRTREGFVENHGAALVARLAAEAPGVRLQFVPKPDRDSTPLREGDADLEIGVVGRATGPEVMVQALYRDRFVGVVRPGHPLARGRVTAARFAAGRHVLIGRPGQESGPIDAALAALGLTRSIAVMVGSFSAALALARASDLVASVPERHTGTLRDGLVTFGLPVALPELTVSLLWHPRLDADPAHRWLRACVREVCSSGVGARAQAPS